MNLSISRARSWISRNVRELYRPTVPAIELFASSSCPAIRIATETRLPATPPLNYLCGQEMRDAGFNLDAYAKIAGQTISEMVMGEIGPCHLVEYIDPTWGHRYCILDSRRRIINLSGTQFEPEHLRIFACSKAGPSINGAWFLDHWFGNYYHWVVFCLPKVMALIDAGMGGALLLPKDMPTPDFIPTSLELLGQKIDEIRRLSSPVTPLQSLTTIEGGRCSPAPLLRLRTKLLLSLPASAPPAGFGERIYITRRNALRRRLTNEEEILAFCQRNKITCVDSETLDFTTQISLFRHARVLVGLHGAGLTNMMWMPPGSHVVEIIGSKTIFPHYYQLALALGHHYWLIDSTRSEHSEDPESGRVDSESDYTVALPDFFEIVSSALRQADASED